MDFNMLIITIIVFVIAIFIISYKMRVWKPPQQEFSSENQLNEYQIEIKQFFEKWDNKILERKNKFRELYPEIENYEIPENLPFKIEFDHSEENINIRIVNGYDCYLKIKIPYGSDVQILKLGAKLGLEAYEAYLNGDLTNYSERVGRNKFRTEPSSCEIWWNPQTGEMCGIAYARVGRDGYYLYSELKHKQLKGELPLVPLNEVIFDD